jgi:hypothetical protein
VGAVVVHLQGGEVCLDLGPADGAPFFRLRLSRTEAQQLSANLRAVANGRDEEILLAEE